MKVDVPGDDGYFILGKQRVASPKTRLRDVTNVESRFDHVINSILCRHNHIRISSVQPEQSHYHTIHGPLGLLTPAQVTLS